MAWILGVTATLVGVVALAFYVSPQPGALIVRHVFNREAADVTKALEKHAPGGIESITDQAYREGDSDALLDVYFASAASAAQPTVIWTHGGAWISGDKSNYAPYYQLLASRGFTVVSLDYSLGPEHQYPTAIKQLNVAQAYVLANAVRFRVDPERIFLAGDSAGSQLTSQLAAAVTSEAYAGELGIETSLKPQQLRGVVLNCGIYDMSTMAGGPGIIGWGVHQSLWAYTGDRRYEGSSAAGQMSTIHHVTRDFPPAYISGGNADPLTPSQSKPLATKLTSLGVDVTTHFFAKNHKPALEHEYQFNLDNADGLDAFERTVDFLQRHSQ